MTRLLLLSFAVTQIGFIHSLAEEVKPEPRKDSGVGGDSSNTVNYDGVHLIRMYPSSKKQIQMVKNLEQAHHPKIEIVKIGRLQKRAVMDVTVGSSDLQSMIDLIDLLQIPYDTLSRDLQMMIKQHKEENGAIIPEPEDDGKFQLNRYHSFEEITEWMQDMAEEFPHIMSLLNIGQSFQGRPLLVAKVSGPGGSGISRPAVWLDSGIHANEWIGPATTVFFISEMIRQYGLNPMVTEMLDSFDVYLFPVFNPDGYHYSWAEDRLWRKSRSTGNNSSCPGVDLNRNWPFKWGTGRADSHIPCRRTYAGAGPASEPEVDAVIRFLSNMKERLKLYIAYHSFSQCWMVPYSYTNRLPPDFRDLMRMSREAIVALHAENGTLYDYGTISGLMGHASGSSVDYVYHELGVKYSFGVELRDRGFFGSLLPREQIIPNGVESLAAVIRVMSLIREELGI